LDPKNEKSGLLLLKKKKVQKKSNRGARWIFVGTDLGAGRRGTGSARARSG